MLVITLNVNEDNALMKSLRVDLKTTTSTKCLFKYIF